MLQYHVTAWYILNYVSEAQADKAEVFFMHRTSVVILRLSSPRLRELVLEREEAGMEEEEEEEK